MVIDNAVPPTLFNKIKNFLCTDVCPWYHYNNVARPTESEILFDHGFGHIVMEDGEHKSNISPFLESAIFSALDSISQSPKNLRRIRAGLLTITNSTIVHTPHVDYFTPHKTGILYMNDSDGDTILYDQYHEDKDLNNFTVHSKITPKSNRLVIFNGLQYHSSSTPTITNSRVVVNFNYDFE